MDKGDADTKFVVFLMNSFVPSNGSTNQIIGYVFRISKLGIRSSSEITGMPVLFKYVLIISLEALSASVTGE